MFCGKPKHWRERLPDFMSERGKKAHISYADNLVRTSYTAFLAIMGWFLSVCLWAPLWKPLLEGRSPDTLSWQYIIPVIAFICSVKWLEKNLKVAMDIYDEYDRQEQQSKGEFK